MCGGRVYKLTKYRRGTDQDLFDFYTGLVGLPAEMLPCKVQEAWQRFPGFPEDAKYNLVISHRRRIQINAECNAQHWKEYYHESMKSPIRVMGQPTEAEEDQEAQEEGGSKVCRLCGRN